MKNYHGRHLTLEAQEGRLATIKAGNWPLAALILTLVMGTLGAGCKSLQMQADWVAAPVLVDGSGSDWDDLHTAYFETEQAVLGVANDSSHLYLMLRTRDPMSARLIAQTGLTFRMAADGSDEELTLEFRAGPSRDDVNALIGPESGPVPSYLDREGSLGDSKREPELLVAVKDRVLQRRIAADGSFGPAAAFGVSKDMFTWEFSIPLEPSHVRFYGLGALPSADVSAVITWGEPKGSTKPQPPDGIGGMGGSGGGGGRGGGGKGGSRGGQRPEEQSRPQKKEVKLNLLLAGSPEQHPRVRTAVRSILRQPHPDHPESSLPRVWQDGMAGAISRDPIELAIFDQ